LIKPSVGRIVWYYPDPKNTLIAPTGGAPMAAIIAYVHSDTMVNLAFFDANGVASNQTSVKLLQDEDKPNPGEIYCEWMPYQVGQAKAAAAASPLVVDPHSNAYMRS